ncbi:MAG: methyltransferase domain-containing protein [Planctomycetes bacterium]|nr:methyltransferase domain-containing protein [Planctomycetota bacterium]
MLERRCEDLEWLDRPDCPADLPAVSDRFMALINRHFGGERLVRSFIAGQLRRHGAARPLRVLDIGSGRGDIPLAVLRWARRQGRAVTFTCVDRRDAGGEAADGLERVVSDIFDYAPPRPFDCAVASMVLHHLTDDRIVELLERLRPFVPRLFISDLRRAWPTYAVCRVLTAAWPAGVRHDAMLSIRRGFRPDELRRLLARLPGAAAQVRTAAMHRVVAAVDLGGGASP